jgi:TPR repeat protein
VKDEAEGVRWYRKAAEQGDAEAQYDLGDAYKRGRGVAKDKAEGVEWQKKSAAQGFKGRGLGAVLGLGTFSRRRT